MRRSGFPDDPHALEQLQRAHDHARPNVAVVLGDDPEVEVGVRAVRVIAPQVDGEPGGARDGPDHAPLDGLVAGQPSDARRPRLATDLSRRKEGTRSLSIVAPIASASVATRSGSAMSRFTPPMRFIP